MSVLIKGMDMPKSCDDCPLAGDFKCNLMPSIPALCKEYDIAVQDRKRLNNCPLVEIPPHGRLIDADALEQRTHYDDFDCLVLDASDINDAPTIIESEEEDG